VQTYLKGIDYPASKEDLISTARSNEAPKEVMDILNKAAERPVRRSSGRDESLRGDQVTGRFPDRSHDRK
jgi:hypothetical protein